MGGLRGTEEVRDKDTFPKASPASRHPRTQECLHGKEPECAFLIQLEQSIKAENQERLRKKSFT